MNNIVSNFDQILKFAQGYGVPPTKRRAVLREYLQSKILELIYWEKASLGLFFVGGTSLRLLYGLDRFSEDLDFDAVKVSAAEIEKKVELVCQKLQEENIDLDLYHNKTSQKTHFELRFPKLLFDLKISQNSGEKLTIKLDFEFFWQRQTREVIFFNRYGFLANVVTKTLNQILVEKLAAFLGREQTQVRDIYDIVWLIAQGAKFDKEFAKANKFGVELINKSKVKFEKEKNQLQTLETKLKPFLLNEQNSQKIKFLGAMLDKVMAN